MDQEYYSSVYSWFEKCGIISNVRTHLRQNLINALKNKDLFLKRDSTPKSAKQYVYDLLIAEYLFNHNYAYTLSVFASEAPLLINFHNTSESTSKEKNNRKKLQEDYILHTLETLGINPYSANGRYIVSQYIDNDIPLLLSILKCMTTVPFNTNDITLVRKKRCVCDESTQTEISWQLYNSDIEKLHTLKKKVFQHKRIIDNKLKERETTLKEQAVIMEQQLATLNSKLQQVQNVMRSITQKEKQMREKKQADEQQILQREMQLTLKERSLLQESNRLQREQNRSRKFEEDLKKLQDELTTVQKELLQKGTYVTPTLKNVEVQTDFAINEATKEDEIKFLTKEKEELSNLVEEQQLRIEQITQRALQLSRQVDEIHSLRPTSVEIPTHTMNVNTIISESSSTEDILQDAKLRLKRLEEESMKADQYYYNFINTSP